MEFDAPIPGESLTGMPKKYPWERPPEITDPKEALRSHVDHLNNPEVMDNVLTLVEAGVPVKELTMGILRGAVSRGLHSPDISLIIAPVIHEKIKVTADKLGVEFEEGLVDKEAETEAEEVRQLLKTRSYLKKELPEPEIEEKVEEVEEDTGKKMGLMARSV